MADMVHHIERTTITVHSPSGFLSLTPEEKHQWLQREYEVGNAVVRRIVEIVSLITSRVGTNENSESDADDEEKKIFSPSRF